MDTCLLCFQSPLVYLKADCKHEVAVVFLDVQKAFNSVPHTPLLKLLHALKFNDNLLKWLSSYLYNREQFVVVDGQVFPMLPVPSGVPQGSVLGPLLFIIYIDCVTKEPSPNTYINLFADDMAIYWIIKSANDYSQLQADIDSVATFMFKNFLQFKTCKSKVKKISSKRSRPTEQVTINGHPLQYVDSYKYFVFISLQTFLGTHISRHSARSHGSRLAYCIGPLKPIHLPLPCSSCTSHSSGLVWSMHPLFGAHT